MLKNLRVIVIAASVGVALYAQWSNEHRFERAAINRCEQRREVDALVKHETIELAAIDLKYMTPVSPVWVKLRHESLVRYAAARDRLGEEQCTSQ